ncbi:MAG: SDR family oxidoreductase [Candidatus Omnitrophica bacterium]|nr:SDR family oxidoreductase [Candidatus Omnitrophota bacterium]
MALYLVTGGAGFIGSNIIEELLKRGEDVRVLDNFITSSRESLESISKRARHHAQYRLIEGDIRSKSDVKKALKDVDYVLHQAALRSVPKSVDNPFLTNDINVNGTLNLLYEAKKAKVKRLVYASSSSAYGNTDKFPQKENLTPRPISPYGVSKLAAENYCTAFSDTFGLETVSLRYFNVFGPRQNPESKYSTCIPAFISRMINNKPPIIEWDGKQSRDFTYVLNVVHANLKAAVTKGISGSVFNIGCGSSISVLEIVNILSEILGKDLKPEYAPKRQGDTRKTYADITKMVKILGIKPKVRLKEGLEKTVSWFKEV